MVLTPMIYTTFMPMQLPVGSKHVVNVEKLEKKKTKNAAKKIKKVAK